MAAEFSVVHFEIRHCATLPTCSKWWSGFATAWPSSTRDASSSARRWASCAPAANRWKTLSYACWGRSSRPAAWSGYDRGHPARPAVEHAGGRPRPCVRRHYRALLVRHLGGGGLRRVPGGIRGFRRKAAALGARRRAGCVRVLAGHADSFGQHGFGARYAQAVGLSGTARQAVSGGGAAAPDHRRRNADGARRERRRHVSQSRADGMAVAAGGPALHRVQPVAGQRYAQPVGTPALQTQGSRIAGLRDLHGVDAAPSVVRLRPSSAIDRQLGPLYGERGVAVDRRRLGRAGTGWARRAALSGRLDPAGRLVRPHPVRTQSAI